MTKHRSIGLLFLVSLFLIITVCYACDFIDIVPDYDEVYTPVDCMTTISVYVESGGPVEEEDWEWDIPGYFDVDGYNKYDYYSSYTISSDEAGKYTVEIYGADENSGETEYVDVYVIDAYFYNDPENCISYGSGIDFDYYIAPDSDWEADQVIIDIYPYGSSSYLRRSYRDTSPGSGSYNWDGKNQNGWYLQPGHYTAKLKVELPNYGGYAEDEHNFYVVKVNAVSVDASNPNSTKVNYCGNPSYVVIPSVNFTAPGKTQQASNVSGSFYFTYDQADAGWGANSISLQYCTSGSETINVTKSAKTPDDTEVLSAYFFPEIGLRVYNHKLRESYESHVYSCTYSGKTIYTTVSKTYMDFHQDYDNICLWGERHKYSWNGGSTTWENMTIVEGWLPPDTRGRECNTTIWCIPTSLKGISDCTALRWDTGSGYVMGVITYSEVDVSMPQ